jgi:hypothetical protein
MQLSSDRTVGFDGVLSLVAISLVNLMNVIDVEMVWLNKFYKV